MSKEIKTDSTSSSKKTRNKVIAVAGLCVVACKIPLLLLFFGFGGVGATAWLLELPAIVQTIGVTIGVLGVIAVIVYFFYRLFVRRTCAGRKDEMSSSCAPHNDSMG